MIGMYNTVDDYTSCGNSWAEELWSDCGVRPVVVQVRTQ